MSPLADEHRAWLEARYRAAGITPPRFRWVRRDAPGSGAPAPSGALLVEDRELRLFLLVLDLDGYPAPEALGARVREDLHNAWDLRSRCLPAQGPGLPGADAAWRVAVHWLGEASQESAWRAAILYIRQEGALLEEIAVDATFRGPEENLDLCLARTGFPSLLLTTRQVFRKDARELELWANADGRVRAVMADLDAAFKDPRAKAVAGELQVLARSGVPERGPLPSGPPRPLSALSVENVRGVGSLTLEPWPGGRPVQAWVVAGPNASGKSSLAEAAALRAFGASQGLCAYLRDPDVTRARNAQGYLSRYLAPVDGGTPRCGLEGGPAPLVPALDLDLALEAWAEADGTLVAQSGAARFLDIPGNELGARMARGFSALATRLEAHLEAGRKGADESRTALARRHGIGATTRLQATFREKIARSCLAAAAPPPPPAALEFLACRAVLPGEDGRDAAALQAAWSPAGSVDRFVQRLQHLETGAQAEMEVALLPMFEAEAERGARLRELRGRCGARVKALPFPPLGLAAQAGTWVDWLARMPRTPGPEAPGPVPAAPELAALLAERTALADQGRRSRPLRDHLEQALAFIREHWRERHPQDCPTCGTRLAAPVEETAAALLADAERQLAAQREEYAALTRRIRDLEQRGSEPGCPVNPETRRQLQAVAEALLGTGVSVEALLREPATRVALERLLAWAEAPPAPEAPPPAPAAATASAAGSILAGWREAERVLAEPEAWDRVAKEVTARLARVVGEHLPATLEALWRELAACLSSAPWLLPAQPRFQPRTLRGANRVDVVLEARDQEPRLARHLLNDAQRNTLGLAWTFCQHLVRGRFRHAWMLLDDPAQDMDQAAYRAFCRFLAALLGLYRAEGRPFTLVLLLGQQDRALDAARETGEGLILLGWTGRQEDATVRRVALFGEGVRSPQPEDLFGQAG